MQDVFSERETKILKLLGTKKLTIKELTEKHFKGQKKPINANNLVAGAILRINRKCDYHKLDWFVNGEGLGRGGKIVWKDEK